MLDLWGTKVYWYVSHDKDIQNIMIQDLSESIYMALIAQREKLTPESWYNKTMNLKKDALMISKKAKNKNKEVKNGRRHNEQDGESSDTGDDQDLYHQDR